MKYFHTRKEHYFVLETNLFKIIIFIYLKDSMSNRNIYFWLPKNHIVKKKNKNLYNNPSSPQNKIKYIYAQSKAKEKIFPLARDLWNVWIKKNKERNRFIPRSSKLLKENLLVNNKKVYTRRVFHSFIIPHLKARSFCLPDLFIKEETFPAFRFTPTFEGHFFSRGKDTFKFK